MSLHKLHPLYAYTYSDKQPAITKLTRMPVGNRNSCFESRKVLSEYVEDNFLMQVVREPTRGGALLDLLVTNREGLVKVRSCLGQSDHEM